MAKYILKRLSLAVLILFGVSIIIYTLLRFLPTDFVEVKFASQLANGTITMDQVNGMKDLYGLNDPILIGYKTWLSSILSGDFGFSFYYEKDVVEVIKESIGISFIVALIGTVLQLSIAIPLGIKAAVKQYSVFDYSTTVFTLLGISLPSFFFSALMIKLFAVDLGWFDASLGMVSTNMPKDASLFTRYMDIAWHLVLPIAVMVILSIGGMMRYMRTNTLEVLNADYIRTARAKGLSEHDVVYKHAFKNTMIPLITTLAGVLPGLFCGSMIIEKIFAIPGIGNKAYIALTQGDIPFVMTYNMLIAVLTVIGVLLSDLFYVVVDPRIKIGK